MRGIVIMPRISTNYLVWLILATMSGASRGQTIFDDGGTHTVNGPSGTIEVIQNTTLNVVSPANVTNTTPQIGSTIVVDPGSTLNLSGGQISNVNVQDEIGIESEGLFTATGGSASGAVALSLGGTALISGGTFQGRDALFTNSISNLSISGGTFTGLNALALFLYPDFHSTVTITGGVFTGMSTQPGELFDSLSDVNILGGTSTVNISGGIFSGPMSLLLQNGSTVNFFGSDLNFDPSTGQLSGVLADGDPLNVIVDSGFSTPYSGPLTISPDGDAITFGPGLNVIPEPRSIVLMASGTLLILAWPILRARIGKAYTLTRGTARQIKANWR
jgi:hypothetical protein